jgi:LmbE family N-acetylglucosaminyl deacetylase
MTGLRLPRPRRAVLALLAVPIFAFSLSARINAARERRTASHPPDLPAAAVPGAGERVLVFAPHPDDETLGVGGLIHQARRNGAEVWVAFFTSGDGFPLCAAARFKQWPGAAAMRRLAGVRRCEATEALRRLGVPADHLLFLGYPDRGLAALWTDHWTPDAPYRSRYTADDATPEGTPYAGTSVLRDVEGTLRRVRPHHIYSPDAADDHPDHWAAANFVRMARVRLGQDRGKKWRTYLIHRGAWPRPMENDTRLFLRPPDELAPLGQSWRQVDLPSSAVEAKAHALAAYGTQKAIARSFLSAFVRRNELLAESLPANPIPLQLEDPRRDRWGRARFGGADFTALEIDAQQNATLLRVRLREGVVPWARYEVSWKPLSGPAAACRTRIYRFTGFRCETPGTRFAIEPASIEVSIPLHKIDGRQVMIAASIWAGPVLLDRTPAHIVTLPELSSGI